MNSGRRTADNNQNVCAKCKHHIGIAHDEEERALSPKRRSGDRKKKVNRDSLDWDNLGEKIEDWFEVAKTPGKRKS